MTQPLHHQLRLCPCMIKRGKCMSLLTAVSPSDWRQGTMDKCIYVCYKCKLWFFWKPSQFIIKPQKARGCLRTLEDFLRLCHRSHCRERWAVAGVCMKGARLGIAICAWNNKGGFKQCFVGDNFLSAMRLHFLAVVLSKPTIQLYSWSVKNRTQKVPIANLFHSAVRY